MEYRLVQNKMRYAYAFLMGTIIFIAGFVFVYSLSYIEYQRISNMQGEVAYDIFEKKLSYSLFDEGVCSETSFQSVSEALGYQGRIIDDLEKKFGKNNKMVLARKKFYTIVLLEHFEFVKLLNEQCGLNTDTILFFYSNSGDDLDTSEEVGKILGVVPNNHPNLVIYSFDVNLESELIENLKERYGVEKSPTLVINEKDKLFNPTSIDEIEQLLN